MTAEDALGGQMTDEECKIVLDALLDDIARRHPEFEEMTISDIVSFGYVRPETKQYIIDTLEAE
jgi:hypothetical protein